MTIFFRPAAVKKNEFNPVWEKGLSLPFDCIGDLLDFSFLRQA
jgi:phosphatidylinositol phospholipase C delta